VCELLIVECELVYKDKEDVFKIGTCEWSYAPDCVPIPRHVLTCFHPKQKSFCVI